MPGIHSVLRWVAAAALVTALLLLAWTCIDIYVDQNEVRLLMEAAPQPSMYRADDIQQRLEALLLPGAVLLGIVLIVSIILRILPAEQVRHRPIKITVTCKPSSHRAEGRNQWFVLMTAIVFVLLGVMNGGWYDVFVKAINICTECIGLG